VLSQQVINRGMTLVSQEPGDMEKVLMLTELNSAYTTLAVTAFARGVHPLVAYTELCRIVGQLSIFGDARRPPEIPHYDHDDLGRIFYYIKEQIELLLKQDKPYQYEQRYFIGEGLGMQVRLESKWLHADWEWYVGVDHGLLSDADCRTLLSELDWKLGSSRKVDQYFTERREGMRLVPQDRPPNALPKNREWSYFIVSKNNEAWKDVVVTTSLAMRLKESLINNRDRLQGERKIEVPYRNRPVELQFALFAVPRHS
jgi:type VI secretion system protein ImpJ